MMFFFVILLVICDVCVCVNFLRAPLENTTCLFSGTQPKRHGRFKPRSELGRLEVGGGGIGHPKLVGLESGKPTPQKWPKHSA